MHSGQRRVVAGVNDEFVGQALGVGEAQTSSVALNRNAAAAEPIGPERERILSSDAVHDAVDHAGAGAAWGCPRVLEERQIRARSGMLVSVEEVVDARIVLVDGLGGQPHPEDPGIEVDVTGRIAGDRGDVMKALESHGVPQGAVAR
jgi:hypothetical protein